VKPPKAALRALDRTIPFGTTVAVAIDGLSRSTKKVMVGFADGDDSKNDPREDSP
jgi:hypothetical protein